MLITLGPAVASLLFMHVAGIMIVMCVRVKWQLRGRNLDGPSMCFQWWSGIRRASNRRPRAVEVRRVPRSRHVVRVLEVRCLPVRCFEVLASERLSQRCNKRPKFEHLKLYCKQRKSSVDFPNRKQENMSLDCGEREAESSASKCVCMFRAG